MRSEEDGADTVSAPRGPVGGLDAAALRVMEANWRPDGYTAPNAGTYPWRWLWDSCFHAVVWAHLGDERALVELRAVLTTQTPDGFVPHIDYGADDAHVAFWGRDRVSAITQPPMYGHALAFLSARGFAPDDELVDRARRGLWYLLRRRRPHPSGLVRLVHPWESGADDSPRWDHWCPGTWTAASWYAVKGDLVGSIRTTSEGSPLHNPDFDVAPAGFNALVAFNAVELGESMGDGQLVAAGHELAETLDARWDDDLGTWTDAGASAAGTGRTRVLDALLPALVSPDRGRSTAALHSAVADAEYGGRYGPAGVHRDEPSFAPRTYWRGPAWPQLTYLLWLAARRRHLDGPTRELRRGAVEGARRSGFAEYWEPDSGQALGAVPQSWAALAAVMAREPT